MIDRPPQETNCIICGRYFEVALPSDAIHSVCPDCLGGEDDDGNTSERTVQEEST